MLRLIFIREAEGSSYAVSDKGKTSFGFLLHKMMCVSEILPDAIITAESPRAKASGNLAADKARSLFKDVSAVTTDEKLNMSGRESFAQESLKTVPDEHKTVLCITSGLVALKNIKFLCGADCALASQQAFVMSFDTDSWLNAQSILHVPKYELI